MKVQGGRMVIADQPVNPNATARRQTIQAYINAILTMMAPVKRVAGASTKLTPADRAAIEPAYQALLDAHKNLERVLRSRWNID